MTTLVRLGAQYGTDKGDERHSFDGRSFLDIYAGYFDPIRTSIRSFMEIGVLEGASLRMWRDYFPFARICGLDIDPTRVFAENRIKVVTGDQNDPDVLVAVAANARPEIIIDDGSHVLDHVLTSLETLWPNLRPGGFYCIEDTRCTWGPIAESKSVWPGQSLNAPGTNYDNDRSRLDEFLGPRLREMDHLRGSIAFVHFWPMLLIIRKAR